MKCPACGANNSKELLFCEQCGKKIATQRKKRIGQLGIAILIFVIASLGIIGAIYLRIHLKPENKLDRLLDEERYIEAQAFYEENAKTSGTLMKQRLLDRINQIESDFYSYEISYEAAVQKLDDIGKVDLSLGEVQDVINRIQELNNSRNAYEKAVTYQEQENYIYAIEEYEKVIENDENYDVARTQIAECKNILKARIIEEAEGYALMGEYENAIITLQSAMSVLDSDLDPLIVKYQIDGTNEKVSVLEAAGNIKEIVVYLKELPDEILKNPEISAQKKRYTNEYKNMVLQEAAKAFDEKNIELANEILQDGLSVLPDDADIRERKELYLYLCTPTSLWDLEYFNKEGRIVESNLTDNVGNVHSTGVWLYSGEYHPTIFIEYLINEEYSAFTGVIGVSETCRDYEGSAKINVYGDDRLLYTSKTMAAGVEPQSFHIGVVGVKKLRIEIPYYMDCNSTMANIYDAQLMH